MKKTKKTVQISHETKNFIWCKDGKSRDVRVVSIVTFFRQRNAFLICWKTKSVAEGLTLVLLDNLISLVGETYFQKNK